MSKANDYADIRRGKSDGFMACVIANAHHVGIPWEQLSEWGTPEQLQLAQRLTSFWEEWQRDADKSC